jgi:hypothetical protein
VDVETDDFFSVEGDGTGNLSFSVFVRNALCQALLRGHNSKLNQRGGTERKKEKKKNASQRTFVTTAIDAYEFPKLIPTTGGIDDRTSIGASALPLGAAFEAAMR